MYLIGDFGSCHMKKWDYIKEAIDLAKDSGLDSIKFQLFKQKDFTNNIEFPRALWESTIEYSRQVGIDCFASVFDNEAVDLVIENGGTKVKLSYSQAFNLPLIKKIKKHGLKIWASGDNSSYPEYADVKFFCIPEYPPKNRLVSYMFDDHFNGYEGLSSHYLGINTDIRYANYFKYIEKHFTLDKDDIICPDHYFALSPKELKGFVTCIRQEKK